MDSLAWSRKYDILSISRLVLRDLGYSAEQINLLTDDDMQAIADGIAEHLSKLVGGFRQEVEFAVDLFLADKHTDIRTGEQDV